MGSKPKAPPPAPKHFFDPQRAKQFAAARAKAVKMQILGAKNQMKVDLEPDEVRKDREGLVIGES